jgi:hypothetical protein
LEIVLVIALAHELCTYSWIVKHELHQQIELSLSHRKIGHLCPIRYAADEGEDDFEDENELDEDEVQHPAPGRPRQYNRNARPPPRLIRDDEQVAKLKLDIPPFEGRYNHDAYLTWELEVEQRLACL